MPNNTSIDNSSKTHQHSKTPTGTFTQTSNTKPMLNKLPDGLIRTSNKNIFMPVPFIPVNTLVRVQYNYNDSRQHIMECIKPIVKCGCCDDVLGSDDNNGEGFNTEDGLVCASCDEDYFSCEECSNRHHIDDSICIFDILFCSDRCVNNYGYFQCDDCSSWLNNDNSYTNADGNGVCESCYDNYNTCEQCGDTCRNENIHYNRDSGCNYCNDCWQGDNDSLIKDYSFKPSSHNTIFTKMEYENTMYLGIELEVECNSNDTPSSKAELVKSWLDKHNVGDLVYFKEDGSLNNGFEIVFMPMTLKGIHKKFPMRRFLAYLQDLKLTSHNKGTCGLHVHLSRKNLSDNEVYKGKLFFYQCQSQLKKLSARTNGDRDDPFHYCQFDNNMPFMDENRCGHFSAFNISNSKTVEIRIFRGTLIYERFLASLQFSDAFGEYIQKVGIAYMKRGNNIWGDFIAWVRKSGKYNQFLKYVVKKRIV